MQTLTFGKVDGAEDDWPGVPASELLNLYAECEPEAKYVL